jgi:hypothetical protein
MQPPSDGRECGCPSWVVRCAHWDGKILILIDGETGCCNKRHSGVVLWDRPIPPSRLGCWQCEHKRGRTLTGGAIDARGAALAEFHRREQELIHAS